MKPIRNDAHPVDMPGYEPTGAGRYAQCPDHGSRMWWSETRNLFFCPATGANVTPHLHDSELYPADVYLEHNEAWRVVNGCLWVDEYEATDDTL